MVTPEMPIQPHYWWVREFVVPVFFTLFGAGIGFAATLLQDYWKAKRAKKSFLRAIGLELDSLELQLASTSNSLTSIQQRFVSGGQAPHVAPALRTTVFTSQIGKVRDVDDPLMVGLIHFYADIGLLLAIAENVNQQSSEYDRLEPHSTSKAILRPQIAASVKELLQQIEKFREKIVPLRTKLPRTDAPK